MKVLGITGGIGCGKSMVIDLMKQEHSCYVIGTDEVAFELMKPGNDSYESIVSYFGDACLQENGEIDRKKLAEMVFQSERKLLKLNSFTHPYVRQYVLNEIDRCKKEEERARLNGEQAQYEYVVVETALPYEARLKDFCDQIWYITASLEIRKERLISNRGYSAKKVTDILNKQLSDAAYEEFSSQVIINDGSKEDILEQIRKITAEF